ncbi:MAG: SAM-dependent chlorinase/fluorinase, partial [Dehalococcoidia bacterium]
MARQDEVTAASPPVIALLTDFGHSDPYVGVMKGVILARAPATQLIDLTHQVPPQSVLEGA